MVGSVGRYNVRGGRWLPGWLRVTAGTPAETDAFLTAMEALT